MLMMVSEHTSMLWRTLYIKKTDGEVLKLQNMMNKNSFRFPKVIICNAIIRVVKKQLKKLFNNIKNRKDVFTMKYEFKATNLIAEAFDKHGVKYRVENKRIREEILADFSVDNGPVVTMKFITDNDNDVAVRIFGIFCKISNEKRTRMESACNYLSAKVRHVKFCVDSDGDVNMEHDFLRHTDDNCVGEMAVEIFARGMGIMKKYFKILAKALYTDEDFTLEDKDEVDRLRMPEEIDNMLAASRIRHSAEHPSADTATSESGGDEAADDTDDFGAFISAQEEEPDSEDIS